MRVFRNRIGLAMALALGAAAAVAVAPAMASGRGNYSITFLERDSQEFSNSGPLMIQMAVRDINRQHATKIEIVGHANCYETEPLELSRQRAERVAEALVAAGVNRELIEIRYIGGAEPGVGSILKQRVDIYIGHQES